MTIELFRENYKEVAKKIEYITHAVTNGVMTYGGLMGLMDDVKTSWDLSRVASLDAISSTYLEEYCIVFENVLKDLIEKIKTGTITQVSIVAELNRLSAIYTETAL